MRTPRHDRALPNTARARDKPLHTLGAALCVVALIVSTSSALGQGAPRPPPPAAATAAEIDALPPPLADYHMHLQSPALSVWMKQLAKAHPAEFAIMDEAIQEPRDGALALKVLDQSGVRYGVLLSEAYMFAGPRLHARGDMAALTRAENAFNVAEAKASGGRLLAFIGVDPLSPTAMSELRYWTRARGASGVKLHLGNSQLNLDSKPDRAALSQVFDMAGREALPIVIHLRASQVFTTQEVNAFIDEVLPKAGASPVQIAHGGGWGFLDEATVQSLDAFADAISAHKPGTDKLTIDLTLVVVDDKTDQALAQRFVAAMRRAGVERFVFGSDWPTKYTPAQAARLAEKGLPLSAAEWRIILAHRAPWLAP